MGNTAVLFRKFSTRNTTLLRSAYITYEYVHFILEYASKVWNHHLLKHLNALERVQRHFNKRNTVLRNLSYEDRLACLDLDTFECRLKADLILYYKIMYNLTPWPIDVTSTWLFSLAILDDCRSDFLHFRPFCRTVAYQTDFFIVVFHFWIICHQPLPVPPLRHNLQTAVTAEAQWTNISWKWLFWRGWGVVDLAHYFK